MIGLKLDQAKGMFFDSAKVMRSVDKATRQVLSRFGSYVRRAAQSSIRKRKKISEAGAPPSSHTGLLKKFIYFGYDDRSRSVVIGPTRLNKIGNATETLEYGGTSILTKRIKAGKYKKKRVTIAKRPYMQPALKKELPKLPAMWRDSVKP